MINKVILFIVLLLVSSCATEVIHSGYSQTMIRMWDKIKVGDTQEEVINLLGTPTIISSLNNNTWYYATTTIYNKRFAFKKYSSRSLEVVFDKTTKKVISHKETNTKPRFLLNVDKNESRIEGINDNIFRKIKNVLLKYM